MVTVRGRVVLPDAILDDGVVQVRDGLIAAVGPADTFAADVRPAPTDDLVLPGLVDLHCHGGGGHSFDALTPGEALAAVAEHRRHGTTTLVASLVTAPVGALRASTALLADLADAGEIAGIHFEGPFISAGHRGAQNPAAIREPDPALTAELLAIGRGHVATMTIAPEAPRAVEVARVLIDGGALPSWGHTSASAPQTRVTLAEVWPALDARGRRATVTHLCNGMAPVHHREPGPILEFLAAARAGRLVVELIGDGVHLDPDTVRAIHDIVGRGNAVLVTDAMAATGMEDGDYVLGSLAVSVRGGVARLTEGQSLAGGTSHLLDVVRVSVAGGLPLVDAVHMASTTPAAVLGRDDVGSLTVGAAADILVTDRDLRVRRVLRKGVDVA